MNSPFSKQVTFVHTGHIGDIIAFLPIFYRMGGTRLVIRDDPGMDPMSGFKYESVKPLLENQGIVVGFNSPGVIDWDMTAWRECYRDDISLMDSQARFVNLVSRRNGRMHVREPWLRIEPDELTKRRVIFNRSPRYHNPKFPWDKVYKHFGDKALFVGTRQEHLDFCQRYGNIEWYVTRDCLEVARAIQGADFFVGNQSSACWIAMALRKPVIQEVFPPAPNSIIEYPGAHFCFDDMVPFEDL